MERYGTSLKSTFYYGPWQCNRNFMSQCQRECTAQGRTLKGCMWLADIKYDFRGQTLLLPIPIQAGSRYAIWHCCCDFPTLSKAQNKALRDEWNARREAIRRQFAREYGDWPSSGGKYWPGHHIQDLWHSGAPVDLANILPTRPDIHDAFGRQYPGCYAGQAPWNTVGPELPYTD
jgi:hypothetical protein